MHLNRDLAGSEWSRAERTEVAAQRLSELAADLGADDPIAPPTPSVLRRPGRHASRRLPLRSANLPGLTPLHLTVVALLIAAGIALTAWWAIRAQTVPADSATHASANAADATSAAPLVAPASAQAEEGVTASQSSGTVTVDVAGKVRRPGIVVLDLGARVVDAVEAAGGERPGVSLNSLNLARPLVDGEQVVVGAASSMAPVPPALPPGGTAPPTLVNLNTASSVELETLPDVGPVTAAAIVAWREEHGGFTSVEQLLEVSGIGEATLSSVAPFVTV